jgi:hypothetical protein
VFGTSSVLVGMVNDSLCLNFSVRSKNLLNYYTKAVFVGIAGFFQK